MAVAARTPWSQILGQFAEELDAIPDQRNAEILVLKSGPDNPAPQREEPVEREIVEAAVETARVQTPPHYSAATEPVSHAGEDLADWTATLDIIQGMASYVDDQRSRVQEQAKSYNKTLQDLQKELRDVHQHVRQVEKQAAETQLQADARVQQIQAEADAKVQEIRLAAEAQIRSISNQADGRVRIAEEKTRAANLRAKTAEKWLQRIDHAAKNLVTSVHTGI